MTAALSNVLCSAASHPTVKLNAAEVDILSRGGFKIENDNYSADPQAISKKAEELLEQVDTSYTTLQGKVSYYTGFGETGRNSELARDLNKVADDIAARGKEGSNTEAPPVVGQGTVAKAHAIFACSVSKLSHTAGSLVGKAYRTY